MKSQNRKKGSFFSKLLTLICLCVFLYSGYQLFNIFQEYYHNRKVLAEVQEIFYKKSVEDNGDNKVSDNKQIRTSFNELQKINQDIIGWITIEDTKIDYPILQSKDNEFYLNHNYKKEYSRAGSIFMDYRNDISGNENNIIIYGHRMKDNTMFNSLKKFLKKDFFDSHLTIYFDTLYDRYDAEVFAVYQTTTDFNYIQTDFNNDEEFLKFVNTIKEKSLYENNNVKITKDDTILTLSTCDYALDENKGRITVQAKLVERK